MRIKESVTITRLSDIDHHVSSLLCRWHKNIILPMLIYFICFTDAALCWRKCNKVNKSFIHVKNQTWMNIGSCKSNTDHYHDSPLWEGEKGAIYCNGVYQNQKSTIGSESVQVFLQLDYICIAVEDPVSTRGGPINWFNPATFICLSQSRP
jgi:hypothetical protein